MTLARRAADLVVGDGDFLIARASEETGRALESALRYFGQAAPTHTADEDSVIFPLAARLLPQAEKMAIAEEMASMSAHQPHSLRALTGFKMLLTMIRS